MPLSYNAVGAVPRRRGFTLIELMITVAIVAIIAAVALPSYFGSVRKSRRADAISAINQVAQAQERYRANQASFGDRLIVASGKITGVGVSSDTGAATSAASPDGYYTITLSTPSGSASSVAYGVAATAVSGKGQTSDNGCQYMRLDVVGGNLSYLAGTSAGTATSGGTSSRCWSR